jgi:hypothetical protein
MVLDRYRGGRSSIGLYCYIRSNRGDPEGNCVPIPPDELAPRMIVDYAKIPDDFYGPRNILKPYVDEYLMEFWRNIYRDSDIPDIPYGGF